VRRLTFSKFTIHFEREFSGPVVPASKELEREEIVMQRLEGATAGPQLTPDFRPRVRPYENALALPTTTMRIKAPRHWCDGA
jgi:hypothetical protein